MRQEARAIEIEGNHIAVTGGMFRSVSNWNVLAPFDDGDLTVNSSDSVLLPRDWSDEALN